MREVNLGGARRVAALAELRSVTSNPNKPLD